MRLISRPRDGLWRPSAPLLNCCAFSTAAGTRICRPAKLMLFGNASSMPRPEYIARLHGAFYDLRTCEESQRPEMLRRYKEILAEAAKLAGCSEASLQAAVAPDYSLWVKQERLPRIDRR